ncbi:hypothetical protein CEXT_16181 [Caerostris extrusa]|uniref:Uncharacterized protein n=1 Tax=Caerostris extrusa TaxID=172846 RepID=A0AAV4NT67_CAEEX|nr:hypothetical protein CEXT_16181 [Caerostris extrusa]
MGSQLIDTDFCQDAGRAKAAASLITFSAAFPSTYVHHQDSIGAAKKAGLASPPLLTGRLGGETQRDPSHPRLTSAFIFELRIKVSSDFVQIWNDQFEIVIQDLFCFK